jgi:CheY-like chemotaxis protein
MGPMPDTVLVVDDNPDFRDLARRILVAWGHEVIEAGTVAEAVALATEQRPVAALVDIALPDGDGFALTERLLSLPWPIKVILTSTDSDAGNGFVARRVGAIAFYPKDELLSAELRELIAERENP